jgi:hypothetical protein
MAGQASVTAGAQTNGNGQGRRGEPERSLNGVVSGIGSLGTSVLSLATLQARLVAADARESSSRIVPAVAGLMLVLPIMVASLTAATFALGHWLHEAFGWRMSAALGVAALAGLLIGGVLLLVSVRLGSNGLTTFRRSKEELERNVAWLGTVLTQSGR